MAPQPKWQISRKHIRKFILLSVLLMLQLLICSVAALDDVGYGRKVAVPHNGRPQYLHEWAVSVKGGRPAALLLARRHGFDIVDEIFPGVFHMKHRRIAKRSAHPHKFIQRRLRSAPEVFWVQQQVARYRTKRSVDVNLNDPKWPRMWYLHQRSKRPTMRVREAWKCGFMGQGVVVTILDDGLEYKHPDLKVNYDPLASTDVNGKDNDPIPRYDPTNYNKHGTRCAGVVVATANNSKCSVGIANKAKIGAVRMLDGDITDVVEATSLKFGRQHIDIYSASWGPDDNGKTVDGPHELTQRAFQEGITLGRGGLGSIYVWASGNGGNYDDNCNCDGYTNSIYTLSVNSVNEHGEKPWYSEPCSSTLAATYSSDNPNERGVVTTDLHAKCTENHTGTSASAPMATALVAVVLSANRKLTWRDMQHIVVRTAKPNHLSSDQHGGWEVNGVGRQVSHVFGYGMMDAAAMVELARNWTTVPPQHVCRVVADIPTPIYIEPNRQRQITLKTSGCFHDPAHFVRFLEHVQAKITLSTSRRGEVEIYLQSPMGTNSILLSKRRNDFSASGFPDWPFMSVRYWGELANGTWSLIIKCGHCTATLRKWHLIMYGTSLHPRSWRSYGRLPQYSPNTKPVKAGSSVTKPSTVLLSVLALTMLRIFFS